MQRIIRALQKPLLWLGQVIAAEITKPIKDIQSAQAEQGAEIKALGEKIEKLHQGDPDALECDLAMMDDAICRMIRYCREKGYTTAEDRRRVGRMHRAYKARGGNHGEENEYAIFEQLMTEEEYNRAKGDIA